MREGEERLGGRAGWGCSKEMLAKRYKKGQRGKCVERKKTLEG